MLKIIGYRIINGHTVTHLTRCHKKANTESDVETFEQKTAKRYTSKTNQPCECWAIVEHKQNIK